MSACVFRFYKAYLGECACASVILKAKRISNHPFELIIIYCFHPYLIRHFVLFISFSCPVHTVV